MPTLHAIHGFIGVGKTTFAKKLSADIGAMYFSHDEFMNMFLGEDIPAELYNANMKKADDLIYRHALRLLNLGHDVILDMDFWSRKRRDRARRFAMDNRTIFQLYFVDCADDLAISRLLERNKRLPEDCLRVDEDSYHELRQYFQPLTDDEYHIYIDTDE